MPSPSPAGAPPSVNRIALLLGTLIALNVLGSSAVAVALPEVARDLSLDTAGTAWVLAAFTLSFAVSTATFGRLADIRGLRLPLRVGALLFVAGSLLAGASWSFPSLVTGRLVQGAGAGAVPVLVVGIVAARFDAHTRVRVFAGLTAVVSVVSGGGPLIGGAITQLLSWRAVLAIPAVAVLLAEPVARLAPAAPAGGGRLDVRGALLVTVSVSGLVLLLQVPATGLGPAAAAGFALLLLAGLAGLALHVRGRPHGLLPPSVLRNRRFMSGAAAGLTLMAAYLAMLLALPLLLSAEHGWSPLRIGLALLPAALIGALVSRAVGAALPRFGRYELVVLLAGGSAAGLLLSAAAAPRPVPLVLGLTLVVAGFAGGQVALIDGVPGLVDQSVRGVAFGVFNLLFFTGGAIGSAAVGGLADHVGLPGALAVVAVLPACGAVAARAARG